MTDSSTPVAISGLVDAQQPHCRTGRLVPIVALVLLLILIALWLFLLGPLSHREPQLSQTALIQRVDQLNAGKRYVSAEKLVKAQHAHASVFDEALLAGIYANTGQTAEALAIYAQLAQDHQLTAGNAELAAGLAETSGDRKLAESYYRQAIGLVQADKSDPVRTADAANLEQQLKALEADK